MKRASLLLLLATVAVAANFAAVDGFSGRTGFDCTSCHNQPVQDDAVAILEGLPPAWEPGALYELTIRVEGGPPANPIGPQGGFEMDASAGTLHIPAGMEGLLRNTKLGMTYLPEGTLMREWRVDWQAPSLDREPGSATFWLAVVSANGNHEYRLNASVAGEFGDAVDTLQVTVPASEAAQDTWESLPLAAPSVARNGSRVDGTHQDANATGIRYQLNGEWIERNTGTTWRIATTEPVQVQSIGAGRQSPAVSVEGANQAPFPVGLAILGLLATTSLRSRP